MFDQVMTVFALPLGMIALALLCYRHFFNLLKGDQEEMFVAEVWLEWEICRGSTMFRAPYSSIKRAEKAAHRAAKLLDLFLPKSYLAEYSSGRLYWESYGFEICWGVRPVTGLESQRGVSRIWTTTMPGYSGHHGEHPSVHPVLGESQLELSGSTDGYKI